MKHLYCIVIFFCAALVCSAQTLDEQLREVIIAGNEPLSLELLSQGADINALDSEGLALMHRYASAGNEFMINWLHAHGADVNVKDHEGSTPIFYAAINGGYRIIYLLMQLGADITVVNQNGMSLRSIAEYFGSLLYQKLFDNPKSYSEKPTTSELYFERQKAIQQGDWNKAISLAKQEFKQAPQEWTKSSPYYTRGLTDLGLLYAKLGRYKEAEKCCHKAVQHWRKTNPNSEQYYFSLTSLAFLKKEEGFLNEALEMLNACAENIKTFSNAQVKWQIFLNRADILQQTGSFDNAENDYKNAFECIKLMHKEMRFEAWCVTYGNLALLHLQRNTPESIRLCGRELTELIGQMEERQLFDQNYLRFKQQLCVYEEQFGSIDLAEENVQELVLATKALLGVEHDDYIVALNLAAEIASKKHKYADSFKYLSDAMDVITHRKEKYTTKVEGSVVHNWASLIDLILEDGSSLWAHEYAYNLAKENYGERSAFYLQQVSTLGSFWCSQKRYDLAVPYLQEAYRRKTDEYGENSLMSINSEFDLWHTYAAIPSMRDNAYRLLQESDMHIKKYVQNMFGIMSEQQREEFWKKSFSSDYSVTRPAFLLDYIKIHPEACGDMYNDVLFTRGLLLNSNDAFNRIIANTKDSVLQAKWQQLLTIKTELNSSQSISSNDRRTLEKKKDKLEREIMLASDAYRLAQENFTTRWQDVQSALKEDEIAIEFTINSINHWGQFGNDKSDSIMYNALILRKGDAHPIFIPLFERDELNQFYDNGSGNDNNMYLYDLHQDAAYNLVWKKIIPYLQNCKTIYFAPTHALAQMALEALPVTKDSVFGDYYNLYRLTSTREVLKVNNPNTPINATLFGGIEYDVSTEDMLAESERYADISISMNRSAEPLDTINRGKIIYLPGTKREVEQIQRELNGTNCHSTVLMGSAANEESFVVLSGQHNNIIHLATHGFFWREDVAREKDAFKQHELQETIDPLSRCGLLFAGANMAYQGHSDQLPEGVQDGILTAREISTMDLSGCDLAVLSACETGVGEYSEDGTIGLQRAFKQAGVQTIIMSLWPVSDAATQLLMTEFYRNWITNHQSKREAFRNAQNTVRTYRDDKGFLMFEEPVYWAGFIMLD